jgi:hypothetical protein
VLHRKRDPPRTPALCRYARLEPLAAKAPAGSIPARTHLSPAELIRQRASQNAEALDRLQRIGKCVSLPDRGAGKGHRPVQSACPAKKHGSILTTCYRGADLCPTSMKHGFFLLTRQIVNCFTAMPRDSEVFCLGQRLFNCIKQSLPVGIAKKKLTTSDLRSGAHANQRPSSNFLMVGPHRQG